MNRHLRSAPDGLAILGWPRLAVTAAALWAAPVALGLVLQGLGQLLPPEIALYLLLAGIALLVSPVFSWVGWVLALPLSALALKTGWFGLLPAAAIGATAGGIAGKLVESELGAGFGLVSVLLLRLILGRIAPAAVDPGPGR